MAKRKQKSAGRSEVRGADYDGLVAGLAAFLDQSRRSAARAVNVVPTPTYWEVGRRVVEFELGGRERADGDELLERLAADLTGRYGRGFSRQNLQQMRTFYLGWEVCQTPSGVLQLRVKPSPSETSQRAPAPAPAFLAAHAFPLPWSHYLRLMTVPNLSARRFYEAAAVRDRWSARQLDRRIATQFYERLGGSRRKEDPLATAHAPADRATADELVRAPYLLDAVPEGRLPVPTRGGIAMGGSPRLGIVILAVRDVRRSVAFYEAALGWRPALDAEVYAEFALDSGLRVGVYQREGFGRTTGQAPAEVPEGGLTGTELYLFADDLPRAVERVSAAGARLLSPVQRRGWGDEAAYFADPDGNVLVLARPAAT